jgi:adenosylhomocysteine nucleosidase
MGQHATTERSDSLLYSEGRLAPPPAPADVAIVAAMPIEVGYLVDSLRRVRKYRSATVRVTEGECANKIVALAVAGIGRAAARSAAELLVAGHRPRWIISAGFAGGLNPKLARNDLVLAREVIDLEGHRFPVDLSESLAAGVAHETGRLLTVDRLVLTPDEKQELHRSSDADLLDMESSAVAALCDEKRVRFLSARVLSDTAGEELPREIATLLSRSGSYRAGAALRALWQRPSRLKEFWVLHERALEAAERLAKFVTRCLEDLPV